MIICFPFFSRAGFGLNRTRIYGIEIGNLESKHQKPKFEKLRIEYRKYYELRKLG